MTKLPYRVAAMVSSEASPSPARKASAMRAWLLTSACSSMRWTTLLAVLWVACCRTWGSSFCRQRVLRSGVPCSKRCCTTKFANAWRARASRSSKSSFRRKPICCSLQCSSKRSRIRLPNWCLVRGTPSHFWDPSMFGHGTPWPGQCPLPWPPCNGGCLSLHGFGNANQP